MAGSWYPPPQTAAHTVGNAPLGGPPVQTTDTYAKSWQATKEAACQLNHVLIEARKNFQFDFTITPDLSNLLRKIILICDKKKQSKKRKGYIIQDDAIKLSDWSVSMSNQIDENLKRHISQLCNNESLRPDNFYVDTIICIQQVTQCIEEIKKQIISNPHRLKAHELLLISAKLELINSDLDALKREYIL